MSFFIYLSPQGNVGVETIIFLFQMPYSNNICAYFYSQLKSYRQIFRNIEHYKTQTVDVLLFVP